MKKEEAKANPIVKAEKAAGIPYKNAGQTSSFAPTSSFMGGNSAWGGQDKSTKPIIENPVSGVNKLLDKATTSKTSTASAEVTQKQQRVDMESSTQVMINIQTQQLQVQQEMVGVLHEIRDTLKVNGGSGAVNASSEEVTPPASNSANRAAEMIRAKSRDIPVSMSINR